MKCEYCGTEIKEKDNFCQGCGTKVTKPQVSSVVEQPKPNPTNVLNNNYQTTKELKRTSPVLIAIIILIVLCGMGFSGYAAYKVFKENVIDKKEDTKTDDKETDDDTDTNDDYDTEAPTSFKRVGTTDYGYIDVPKEWVVFEDTGDYATAMMQYSNTAGTEILTMMSNNFPTKTAQETAKDVYNSIASDGATNLEESYIGLEGLNTIYEVSGYYASDNVWLFTWTFSDEDGRVHYVALESPDKYSEIFDLIYTYSLEK